jgi:hypothetical protein
MESLVGLDAPSASREALDRAGADGLVLATGSLYVVAPARLALRELLADR